MIPLAESAGWAGAGCLLAAYGLLSARRITAGLTYQLLNLAGAAGLAGNAVVHDAWPSACLNLLWLVIGLAALRRERARRRISSFRPGGGGSDLRPEPIRYGLAD